MCVFVSRPMKIVTFLRKNGDLPKRVVNFPRERSTFRNKIMEIVEDFDDKSHNNNGKPWTSSRILCVNPFFSFFFLFSSFFISFTFSLHHFFHYFFFSFFHFFISLISFTFSFLSFFIFFHFLHFSSFLFSSFLFSSFFFSFSFSIQGCSKSVFFGLNRFKIYCNISSQKIIFSSRLGEHLFGPSFLFFLLSIVFLSFLLLFFFFFFHSLSRKKFLLFFFLVFLFKCVLLLALVSEFNCFLRSLCSMEMWCPDDTGRESMIQLPRVGWRLLACENGASPDCIVVVVVSVRG